MLTDNEKEKINNKIADERVEKDGPVRKAGNIAERAVSILGGSGNNISYTSTLDDKRFIELAKEQIKNREKKNMGGILQDDETRMGYKDGEDVSSREAQQEHFRKAFELTDKEIKLLDYPEDKAYRAVIVKMEKRTDIDGLQMELEKYRNAKPKERKNMYGGGAGASKKRMSYDMGGSLLSDDMSMDMPMETPDMKSDDDMEEDYVEHVMSKLLSDEEQEFLNKELEGNDKLSVIFDKVVGGASEFSGSGPIEGPGTGVSDDIPARLSDGEFVFTAKAVEEIGEDALTSMMKEAEDAVDKRQGLAFGGILENDEEEELESSNISDDMRMVNPRLNPNLR